MPLLVLSPSAVRLPVHQLTADAVFLAKTTARSQARWHGVETGPLGPRVVTTYAPGHTSLCTHRLQKLFARAVLATLDLAGRGVWGAGWMVLAAAAARR